MPSGSPTAPRAELRMYVAIPRPGGKCRFHRRGFLPSVSQQQGVFLSHKRTARSWGCHTTTGDSFHADKPQLWSPGQFTVCWTVFKLDVHPDASAFAVLKAPATGETSPVNKVSFILNFFDELRRKVPPGKIDAVYVSCLRRARLSLPSGKWEDVSHSIRARHGSETSARAV